MEEIDDIKELIKHLYDKHEIMITRIEPEWIDTTKMGQKSKSYTLLRINTEFQKF